MEAIKKALRRIFVFFWRKPAEEEYRAEPIKRSRKKRLADDWTLGVLLSRLDDEHARFKLKRDSWSSISRRDRKALQRMGPFVFPPSGIRMLDRIQEPGQVASCQRRIAGMSPPPQAYIGFYREDRLYSEDKDEAVPIISMFALRQDNAPVCGLQKTPGERYLVGYSWGFGDDKETYVAAYATIEFDTGAVHIPSMLTKKKVRLPRAKGCHEKRRRTSAGYMQPVYEMPNSALMCGEETPACKRESEARKILVGAVSVMFSTWAGRDNQYQISTRKGKGRVTFCIDPGIQVPFFKDRDKTAIASDGKRKRIVHYVRSHERVTETKTTTVKEHLRGIRKFLWNGYDVAVTIPKFHIEARGFSPAPQLLDPKDFSKGQLLDAAQLSARLVDIEDNHEYKHGAH